MLLLLLLRFFLFFFFYFTRLSVAGRAAFRTETDMPMCCVHFCLASLTCSTVCCCPARFHFCELSLCVWCVCVGGGSSLETDFSTLILAILLVRVHPNSVVLTVLQWFPLLERGRCLLRGCRLQQSQYSTVCRRYCTYLKQESGVKCRDDSMLVQ